MGLIRSLRQIGPGALVTAAFIGPGTVTVCTLAGANYGYALLWALGFATFATIVLQEMAGRLGTVTQRGLGEALRSRLAETAWRWPLFALILVALCLGNAAYEAGNLSGAALGAEALFGGAIAFERYVGALAIVAGAVLLYGRLRTIERLLLALVLLMAFAFLGTFIVSGADWPSLLGGLLRPRAPPGSALTVLALIGTTVVPYNLFLHAAAARSRWSQPSDLATMRLDTAVSIGLGGLVSMLVVSTAAAGLFAHGLTANNAVEMAVQLEPVFGAASRYLLGLGLLAAGLTSSITAPYATAVAVVELFGVAQARRAPLLRAIALLVLAVGLVSALSGFEAVEIIVAAQFANGLLLPIVAGFLLLSMNDRRALGCHANGRIGNALGALVCCVAAALGARLVADVLARL